MNALLRLVCAGTFLLAACGDEPSPTPDTDASTVDITSDLAVDDDGGVDITVDVSLIEDAPVDVPDLVADHNEIGVIHLLLERFRLMKKITKSKSCFYC